MEEVGTDEEHPKEIIKNLRQKTQMVRAPGRGGVV